MATTPVAVQTLLVAPRFAIGSPVVPQGRTVVGERLAQYIPDRIKQNSGPLEANSARRRVDSGPPQGLIGVDVAHPCDRSLRQEVRLHMASAGTERRVECGTVQRGVKRFGPQPVQGWKKGVLAGYDNSKSAEPSNVPECHVHAVVQGPARTQVGVIGRGFADADAAGHPKVDHKFLRGNWIGCCRHVQANQQVLSASVDLVDPVARGQGGIAEPWRRVGMAAGYAGSNDEGLQLTSHRLHLGQLRHRPKVPPGPVEHPADRTGWVRFPL